MNRYIISLGRICYATESLEGICNALRGTEIPTGVPWETHGNKKATPLSGFFVVRRGLFIALFIRQLYQKGKTIGKSILCIFALDGYRFCLITRRY